METLWTLNRRWRTSSVSYESTIALRDVQANALWQTQRHKAARSRIDTLERNHWQEWLLRRWHRARSVWNVAGVHVWQWKMRWHRALQTKRRFSAHIAPHVRQIFTSSKHDATKCYSFPKMFKNNNNKPLTTKVMLKAICLVKKTSYSAKHCSGAENVVTATVGTVRTDSGQYSSDFESEELEYGNPLFEVET